jgi:hypothetical protein
MANNLAANTPIKFSLKLVKIIYNETIYPLITNTSYEGEIKNEGDRVRVRTAGRISLSTYTKGMTLVAQDLTPTSEDLIIDQAKYFKFVVDDIDKLQNDVNTMDEYAANARMDMSELIDTDILSYGRKNVFGLNAVGTDYSTGTAAIAATTGVVTGTGTTFTAAMVGGYLRITGHPTDKHYLVTAYTSGTSITVTDLDSTAYTGGALSATTYTIKAATALALTKTNIAQYLIQVSTVLSQNTKNRTAPRWIVVNALLEGIIRQAAEFAPAVNRAYDEVVRNGDIAIGRLSGFNVVFSELVDGNNTTGFWFLAGTKEFMAFAAQIMKVSFVDQANDPNSFVSTCKGLLVYGRKTFEQNRYRGAVLRGTIA